jgi:hypothetical protein
MKRIDALRHKARALGLEIDSWAPGDGKRRYRLLRPVNGEDSYFGGAPIWTALGIAEAELLFSAFSQGYHYAEAGK